MTLLLALAALVWCTRRVGEDVVALLSLILGAVSTLGGYYQGHREAEEANARAAAAGDAVREVQEELRRAREELAEAKAALTAIVPLLAEISPEKRK